MCDKCKDDGNILDGYLNTTKGEVFTRLRFDLDNNQFDMQYGIMGKDVALDEYDWTHSIDISFCPFCGKRLSITMNILELINFIKPDSPVEVNSEMYNLLSLLSFWKDESSNFTTRHNYLINTLTDKYRTEVIHIVKTHNIITIVFKEPEYNR